MGFDIFEILRNEVDEKLIGMLTEAPTSEDNNATVAAKLLYSSCMNEGKQAKKYSRSSVYRENIEFLFALNGSILELVNLKKKKISFLPFSLDFIQKYCPDSRHNFFHQDGFLKAR